MRRDEEEKTSPHSLGNRTAVFEFVRVNNRFIIELRLNVFMLKTN